MWVNTHCEKELSFYMIFQWNWELSFTDNGWCCVGCLKMIWRCTELFSKKRTVLARIFKRKVPMERSFSKLNGYTLFVKIGRELELKRLFEIYRLREKRSLLRPIRSRGQVWRKEQPFSVVMVTRIALYSMAWTKLRGRRSLSTRERTSFVAYPQTENGRVLSWRADLNFLSCTFCHISQTFEEVFHRAFHDWTRSV